MERASIVWPGGAKQQPLGQDLRHGALYIGLHPLW